MTSPLASCRRFPYHCHQKVTILAIIVIQCHLLALVQLSHGIHLSNSISFTALDMAKSAGINAEEIEPVFLGESEEDLEEPSGGGGGGGVVESTVGVDGVGGEESRNVEREPVPPQKIPPITEVVKDASGVPVLPLCCTVDTEDTRFYRCGGSSVSAENVNDNRGFQKSWNAPEKLVSSKVATKFRLEKSVLSCSFATFSASISLDVNSTENHFFYPDGHLKFENEFYRINEYCISSIKRDQMFLQICQANCTNPLTPCIQRCCGLDELYSFGSDDNPGGCQPIQQQKIKSGVMRDSGSASSSIESGESVLNNERWSPILYKDMSFRLSDYEISKLTPHFIQRYPSNFKNKCKSRKTTVFPFGKSLADYISEITGKPFRNLEFRLRQDGWLLYPFKDSRGNEIPVINRIQNYCVDGAQHYGESRPYTNDETQTVLFLCSGGVDEAFENNIIVPESEESDANNDNDNANRNNDTDISVVLGKNDDGGGGGNKRKKVSSAEIYAKSKQKPHVLYQLFQLNSHSRPANIIMNHNIHKLTKIKRKRPGIINLFPNHPNRTRIVTKKRIKKPRHQLPVCCGFPNDVNDGQTYHCRNRMVDFVPIKTFKNSTVTVKPIWNVPSYFMTNGQDMLFSLETSPVDCVFGQWQLQGYIHNFELNGTNSSSNQRKSRSYQVESGILSDGYLKYENEFYSQDEYCINGLSPRIIEVLICKPTCKSKQTPCVSKCCGMDEAYSLGIDTGFRGCSPLSEDDPRFKPTFYRNMHYPLSEVEQEKIQPHFIQKYPPTFRNLCYRGITLAFPFSEHIAAQLNPESSERGPTFKNLQFRFRTDGKLMYTVPNDDGTTLTAIYDRNEFCVDLVSDFGSEEPLINHENQTILFICASQPSTQDEDFR